VLKLKIVNTDCTQCLLFIDAAKRNPITSRATDAEVEDEVKTWLRGYDTIR